MVPCPSWVAHSLPFKTKKWLPFFRNVEWFPKRALYFAHSTAKSPMSQWRKQNETVQITCLLCRKQQSWQLSDCRTLLSLVLSCILVAPSSSGHVPDQSLEVAVDKACLYFQSANICFIMWQLKIASQTLCYCPMRWGEYPTLSPEALSPTCCYFLPVGRNRSYSKRATIFRSPIYLLPLGVGDKSHAG